MPIDAGVARPALIFPFHAHDRRRFEVLWHAHAFSDVSLFVARTDRFGLVGPNGAGKSTLFNLILGEEAPDEGTITWERGADFGFLPQESAPVGEETVLQIATTGQSSIPIPTTTTTPTTPWSPGPRRILSGLGFREADLERPAKSFSGGW